MAITREEAINRLKSRAYRAIAHGEPNEAEEDAIMFLFPDDIFTEVGRAHKDKVLAEEILRDGLAEHFSIVDWLLKENARKTRDS